MKKKGFQKKYLFVLLLPAAFFLAQISAAHPEFVEKLYSNTIYKPIGIILSNITGIFPFSVAELTVLLLTALLLYGIGKVIMSFIRRKPNALRFFLNYLGNILIFTSIIYFLFMVLWGLNYYRQPFSKITGLDVSPADLEELEEVCVMLINNANDLRQRMGETETGTMKLNSTLQDAYLRAGAGYENASSLYAVLDGKFGRPKGVFASVIMSYAGISGVYFPLTSEANVNKDMPPSMLPCTISHEMAHQRGFAREDEANYIAYLTCRLHPDDDFKYSGVLLALINSMNALYSYDREKYLYLRQSYSEGVNKDLGELNAFWQKYEGPFEKISNSINDTYLKANRQQDGVHSYGRMVDLIIAEHRAEKQIP
ncbi:hypothetical protein OXPF_26870 [Oxobacter pfennigii]|uniref:DUF3810 domain-containing protein n=1 Tax=Oxobacter pfennigii TaxID=36849 RepID=A0A0P9AET3_9CLOT|nr:DUF3810 domain-containing protein [Oxobacter pfennigii]KPU43827.1 hypothetical protein OXPF_26870 [Oxobacter pfennigii]